MRGDRHHPRGRTRRTDGLRRSRLHGEPADQAGLPVGRGVRLAGWSGREGRDPFGFRLQLVDQSFDQPGHFFEGVSRRFQRQVADLPNIQPAVHKSGRIVPPWADAHGGSGQRCDPPGRNRRLPPIGDNNNDAPDWRPTRSASEGCRRNGSGLRKTSTSGASPGNPPATATQTPGSMIEVFFAKPASVVVAGTREK